MLLSGLVGAVTIQITHWLTAEFFALAKIVMRPPAGGKMKQHRPSGVFYFLI